MQYCSISLLCILALKNLLLVRTSLKILNGVDKSLSNENYGDPNQWLEVSWEEDYDEEEEGQKSWGRMLCLFPVSEEPTWERTWLITILEK